MAETPGRLGQQNTDSVGLRERAREAVGQLSVVIIDGRMGLPSPRRCADAASAVWQPENERLQAENERLRYYVHALAPSEGRYVIVCDDGSIVAAHEVLPGDDVIYDRGQQNDGSEPSHNAPKEATDG